MYNVYLNYICTMPSVSMSWYDEKKKKLKKKLKNDFYSLQLFICL